MNAAPMTIENDKIYRILSFNFFKDLVERQALAFVTYDSWEDPCEGYVLRELRTEEGHKRIVQALNKMYLGLTKTEVERNVQFLYMLRHTMHMQSWTKTEEDDAMWQIYSGVGEGVQISTTLSKVANLGGVSSVSVRYKEPDPIQDLKSIFVGKRIECAQVFSTKRPAFSYEQEIRLLTSINMNRLTKRPNDWLEPGILRELLAQLKDKGEVDSSGIKTVMGQVIPNWLKYISFNNVPNFIESVRVNPFATSIFVEQVQKYCEENKIPFLGKSELYAYKPVFG